MEYSITTLADEFDVSMRALRYYESEGLLFPKRQMTRRIYSDVDRLRLGIIVALRKVNFKLDHIKDIMALFEQPQLRQSHLNAFLKHLHEQRQTLQTEADALSLAIGDISAMARRTETTGSLDNISPHENDGEGDASTASLSILADLLTP